MLGFALAVFGAPKPESVSMIAIDRANAERVVFLSIMYSSFSEPRLMFLSHQASTQSERAVHPGFRNLTIEELTALQKE
jgi:hypothetical protein